MTNVKYVCPQCRVELKSSFRCHECDWDHYRAKEHNNEVIRRYEEQGKLTRWGKKRRPVITDEMRKEMLCTLPGEVWELPGEVCEDE